MRFILILALLLSCQTGVLAPVYVPVDLAPTVAVHSTFRVFTKLNGEKMKSGTAFVISETEVMTAGHVCSLGIQIEGLDLEFEPEGIKSFTLQSQDDKYWEAELVRFSKSPDLCILKVNTPLPPALPFAKSMPDWGDHTGYVGAPRGMWGKGTAMLYEGRYSGDSAVSIFTAPGASGSAVFTKDGVYGVLVAVHPESSSITLVEPLDKIRKFIDDTRASQSSDPATKSLPEAH